MSQEHRTSQKLRFAKLHLDELRNYQRKASGDDFERAHQEAFLAQLFGAYSSFLQELNAIFNCALDTNGVTLGNMRRVLLQRGAPTDVLSCLYRLAEENNSWFNLAKVFRDVTTHYAGIPISFYVGGPEDGRFALKHPITLAELPGDAFETMQHWLDSMEKLISELRKQAQDSVPPTNA